MAAAARGHSLCLLALIRAGADVRYQQHGVCLLREAGKHPECAAMLSLARKELAMPLTRGPLPWCAPSALSAVRAVLLQAQRSAAQRARPAAQHDPRDTYACAPQMRVLRDALDLLPPHWLLLPPSTLLPQQQVSQQVPQ